MIRCGDLVPFGHFWGEPWALFVQNSYVDNWALFHSDSQDTLISFITLTTGGAEVHAGDLRGRGESLGHVHPRPERVQPLDSADLFGFQEPSRSPGVAPEVHPGDEVG